MANKNLFQTIRGMLLPKAKAKNEAGGVAYELPPKQKLAQYVVTGCLNGTYYASADEQLETVMELCAKIDPEFIARLALYAREKGYMKDMPALLCAILAVRNPGLLCEVFDRVIDNGMMLRVFVQIVRSGVTGRKSFGTLPKRLIRKWFEGRPDDQVFKASVGNAPSLADVIKMVHPKPQTPERNALYGYLLGRAYETEKLPVLVRAYESFKRGETLDVPKVPFEMLTALPLAERDWVEIARNAPWQMTRMNLNTFERHGVFKDAELTRVIADRLRDREQILKARVFPYQLMAAYLNTGDEIPFQVREALQDALEIALENVPSMNGKVYVFPDVSGSMQSPATGHRKGATSKMRCVDVAALVAAALVRKNPGAEIVPFSDNTIPFRFNPRDPVMTIAEKLVALPSGGTNCSAPLAELNRMNAKGDVFVYVSDNESWIDKGKHGATATMSEWQKLKYRCPDAKLACIDLQPYGTTQAPDRGDILNVGGFSDQVFTVLSQFADGSLDANHAVGVINKVTL